MNASHHPGRLLPKWEVAVPITGDQTGGGLCDKPLRIWAEGGHLLSAETWIANSFHLVDRNFRLAQRFFEEDAMRSSIPRVKDYYRKGRAQIWRISRPRYQRWTWTLCTSLRFDQACMLLKLNVTNEEGKEIDVELVQEDVSFLMARQVTDIECPLVGCKKFLSDRPTNKRGKKRRITHTVSQKVVPRKKHQQPSMALVPPPKLTVLLEVRETLLKLAQMHLVPNRLAHPK
ncbi:hypothetical protein B0H13DRAFT_1867986 [Mycena leptocephala]|nr:hypothetical protein B0H13DRAFT_1867986 [Mycena leptocephala]